MSRTFPKCWLAHAGERARDLVERVRTIDRDAQTACCDCVPQVGSHLLIDLTHFLDRARPERHADVADALERVQGVPPRFVRHRIESYAATAAPPEHNGPEER